MGSRNILELQSVQSSNLRILFEVLKDVLLSDINIIFMPDGIKVVELDGSKVCLIHLTLEKKAFEVYKCDKKTVLGINSNNFYKIIKTANNSDTISFFVPEDDQTSLHVRMENSEKSRIFESTIRLLDVEFNMQEIPDVEFNSTITLPSSEFQKICKDMNSLGIGNKVEIISVGEQIIFCYKGDFSDQRIILGKSDNTVFNNGDQEIVQGVFNLKFLLLFTKATNLCNMVTIYLKNEYPLILEYSVGSLGSLRFILTNIID
jgi:proliferating cell nuclear antigen